MNGAKVINTILEREGIKAATFAKQIGVTSAQVYDLQKGKIKGISSAVADKIIKVYPHYSKAWLMTGEGEMLKVETNPGNKTEIIHEGNIIKVKLKPKEAVQLNPQFGGFTEKLRLLGYDEPKEESGYKVILAQVLTDVSRNPTAFAELITGIKQPPTLTEQMVDMLTKPLVKQLREAERTIAEKDMIIANYEAKAKKDLS